MAPAVNLVNGGLPDDIRSVGEGLANTGRYALESAERLPGAAANAVTGFATQGARIVGGLVGANDPDLLNRVAFQRRADLASGNVSWYESGPLGTNADAAIAGGEAARREQDAARQLTGHAWPLVTPGVAGNAAMAGLMMTPAGLVPGIAANLGIPTLMGATKFPEGIGQLAGNIQPQNPTTPLGAVAATALDPEVASQYPLAAMMAGGAMFHDLRGAAASPEMGRPETVIPPVPMARTDTGWDALPGRNLFDMAGKALRTLQKPPVPGPEGPIPSDRPSPLAAPFRYATGHLDTARDVLGKMTTPEEAKQAMGTLAKGDADLQEGRNYSDAFEALAGKLPPVYQRFLFNAMARLPRADSDLGTRDMMTLVENSRTPQGEATAYKTLFQHAQNNWDVAHGASTDPVFAKMRDVYAAEIAQQEVAEYQSGVYKTQPGQQYPRAASWYSFRGPSREFSELGLGSNANKAWQDLRAQPSNYTGEQGAARTEADQSARQILADKLASVSKQGEAMVTGQRPANAADANLPPLPDGKSSILTPDQQKAKGAVYPGAQDLPMRAELVRQALAPWAKDPQKAAQVDTVTQALLKGQQLSPEGLQALKAAKDYIEDNLSKAPQTAKLLGTVEDELQRQYKEANRGHAYLGQTLEVEQRKIDEAREQMTFPRAKYASAPEAFARRLSDAEKANSVLIRDPVYAFRTTMNALYSEKAANDVSEGLKGTGYVEDLTGKDPAVLRAYQQNGWTQVPENARFGALSGKWVPKILQDELVPWEKAYHPGTWPAELQNIANWLYSKKALGSMAAVNRDAASMLWQAHSHLGIGPQDWIKVYQLGRDARNDSTYYQQMRGLDYGTSPGRLKSARIGVPDLPMKPVGMSPEHVAQWTKLTNDAKELNGGIISSAMHAENVAEAWLADALRAVGGETAAATFTPKGARDAFGLFEDDMRHGAPLFLAKERGVPIEEGIAHTNQAFVNYANKSPMVRDAERFGFGLGNRFIHWGTASAADTLRLLTGNPVIALRTMSPHLAAAAWASHFNAIEASLAVQGALAAHVGPMTSARKKELITQVLSDFHDQKDLEWRQRPDWFRGPSSISQVPVARQNTEVQVAPEEEGGLPGKRPVNRTVYADISASSPHDGILAPLDMAYALWEHDKYNTPIGTPGPSNPNAEIDLPMWAKGAELAMNPASAMRLNPADTLTSPYNTRQLATQALNIAAPPQLSQEAAISGMEYGQESPTLNEMRGAAPDFGTSVANRWLGALRFWYSDPELNAMRAAATIEQQGSAMNKPGVPGESLGEWKENIPRNIRSLKGLAQQKFNIQPEDELK